MEDPGRAEEAGIGAARTQRQRSSLPSVLFILLMLLLLTSHNGEEFLARHQYQEALQNLTYQLSNYSAWMNGTESNFSLADRNPVFTPLMDVLLPNNGTLDTTRSTYYSNITGFIHGNLKLHNITSEHLKNSTSETSWSSLIEDYMKDVNQNSTEVAQTIGTWNWTASEKVAFSVVEKLPLPPSSSESSEKVALVHGRIEFTNAQTAEDLRLELEGIHLINKGTIFGFAGPSGYHLDIRLLPSLVPDESRNSTLSLIEPELNARIAKLKNLIDAGIIEEPSNDDPPQTACPFLFFSQLDSVNLSENTMDAYEEELQKPTGVRVASPPRLSMKAILLSKECGILYEITNMEGLRSKTFFRKVTTYAGTAAIAYLILIIIFTRQMARSSTPSGISRVSRYTFLIQATVDSVSFAGHITFAVLAEGRPSLSLVAPSFLACITFMYEAQFSMNIYQIQLPENLTPSPPLPPAVAVPTPPVAATPPNSVPSASPVIAQDSTANAETTTLPAPTTQATPTPAQSMSFWTFFWQQVRSDPQARLYITLFIFLSSIVRIILSPTLTLLFLGLTYSCIWLPQIVRSIRRGRSSGLSKEYIVGTTLCRLYLMMYFLVCPRNVLDVEPRQWSYFLAAFVCFQALVLVLQEYLGPAFFLPKQFAEVNTYDYHPLLPLPDSESPEQSLGDCSICMDAIHVDPLLRGHNEKVSDEWDVKASGAEPGSGKRKGQGDAGSGTRPPGWIFDAVQKGVGSAVTRKNYSLAPCHHLFHTECLEHWLAIKNICPQCRRPLPPL